MRIRALRFALLAAVLLAVPAPFARAQGGAPPPDDEGAIRDVEARIRDAVRREREAGTAEKSVLDSLERLDALADLRRAEQAALARRAASLRRRFELSGDRIAALDGSASALRRQLLRRVGMIHRLGRARYLGALLGLGRGSPTAMRQLAYLADRDREGLRNLRADQEALAAARGAAVEDERALDGLRLRLLASEEELRRNRSEKERVLRGARAERRQWAAVREELAAASGRLREFVERLPEEPDPEPALPLDGFRGRLPWPVRGRLVQRFGKAAREPVPSLGIGIEAPAGAPIQAIHPGRVVFADWFKGYGKTAIVDHGGGWFSVYGHASELLVHLGERVRAGQTIGHVGDTGSVRGTLLYFEITRERRPVDPLEFLEPAL